MHTLEEYSSLDEAQENLRSGRLVNCSSEPECNGNFAESKGRRSVAAP